MIDQQSLIRMITANLPDVSPTREQMQELHEINKRGIDAQNEHFGQPAGTAPRICHGCQERFDCGYTFSAYSGTIGQPLWQQSRCDSCLSEPGKPAKKAEPRIERYGDFDEAKLPESARKIASTFLAWTPAESTGIGLIGLPATGKSYLLYELGRRLQARGAIVAVLDDRDINDLVRPGGAKDRGRLLKQVQRCKALLWDDFGTARMTDSVEEFLNRLLEICYQQKIPILATTNYPRSELKDQWERQSEGGWQGARADKILRRLGDRCHMIKI